jgi:hypothetical protein
LHENLCTCIIIFRSVLPKISDKSCRDYENTYFMFNNFFSRKSQHLWNNVEKYGRAGQATDDDILRHMCTACWITKATDTHSEYVISIAFPRQQWYANAPPRYVTRTLPVLINSAVALQQVLLSGSRG